MRFGRSALPWTPENAAANVVLHPERLMQPLKWTRPRMIFVNSMSDMFHPLLTGLPDETVAATKYPRREGDPPRPDFIAKVFAVMTLATQHTFQVLTKRPRAMASILSHPMFWLQVSAIRMEWGYPVIPGGMTDLAEGRQMIRNLWLGTSVENSRYLERVWWLRRTPAAAVRFVSAEPLLGSLKGIELRSPLDEPPPDAHIDVVLNWKPKPVPPPVDWLIAGGESGPGYRPVNVDHVRELRDACVKSGTAFFFKQMGGQRPKSGGKLLDGREWCEMPGGLKAA